MATVTIGTGENGLRLRLRNDRQDQMRCVAGVVKHRLRRLYHFVASSQRQARVEVPRVPWKIATGDFQADAMPGHEDH